MHKKKTSGTEALYGELGHAFNFTQGDLEANKAGFLSFRQRQIRRGELVLNTIIMLLVVVIVLAAVATWAFFLNTRGDSCGAILCFDWTNAERIQTFLAQLLCSSPFWLFLLWSFFANRKDTRTGRIEKLVSKLGAEKIEGKYTSYYLVSSVHRFQISPSGYEYDWGDIAYVVYYLPFSKQLLSIEAMEQRETKAKKLPSPDVPYGEYGRAFKFTQNDLEANHAGFISEAQKQAVVGDALDGGCAMIMPGIIVVASCIYIIVNFILWAMLDFDTNTIQFLEFKISLSSSFFILVFGAISLWGYSKSKRADIDSKETQVQVYNGYELYRLEHKVSLNDEQIKLLERYPVRIYAMPTTKKILSVQILLPEQE